MKIRGVAFDLEGTIIDLERAHHLGHIAAAGEIGLHLTLDEAIQTIPAFVGGPDERVADELCRRAKGTTPSEELLRRMRFHYAQNIKLMSVSPRLGFLAIVKAILNLGLPIAIGTLTCRKDGLNLIEAVGITKLFSAEHLVFGESVKNKKPSPDVYYETAQRMGIDPKEQVVFEDSVPGIEAAKLAGSFPVAVPVIQTAEYMCRLLQAGAKRIVWEWSELQIEPLLRTASST